jgi:hypothetical protein
MYNSEHIVYNKLRMENKEHCSIAWIPQRWKHSLAEHPSNLGMRSHLTAHGVHGPWWIRESQTAYGVQGPWWIHRLTSMQFTKMQFPSTQYMYNFEHVVYTKVCMEHKEHCNITKIPQIAQHIRASYPSNLGMRWHPDCPRCPRSMLNPWITNCRRRPTSMVNPSLNEHSIYKNAISEHAIHV